jgi:hypothetical protein
MNGLYEMTNIYPVWLIKKVMSAGIIKPHFAVVVGEVALGVGCVNQKNNLPPRAQRSLRMKNHSRLIVTLWSLCALWFYVWQSKNNLSPRSLRMKKSFYLKTLLPLCFKYGP